MRVGGQLSRQESAAVLDLVQRAADEDGVSPLSEHVMLHLRYGGDVRARNVLLWYDGELAGYGHLDPTDPVEGPAAEMVIDPAARRHGLGLVLGRTLSEERPAARDSGYGRTATYRERPGLHQPQASAVPVPCGRCVDRCRRASTSPSLPTA